MVKEFNGSLISDEELLKGGMNHLAEAACFLYEIESPEGIAMAVMVNAALEYGEAIMTGRDPRLSRDFDEELANIKL